MEGLEVTISGDAYKRGSWLALWLKYLGSKITGLALTPDSTPSHWNLLNLDINVVLSLEQLQNYKAAASQSGLKWIRK